MEHCPLAISSCIATKYEQHDSISSGLNSKTFFQGICVTPGLTFGYGGKASRESMGFERLRHDQIVKKIKACNEEDDGSEVQCVSRLRHLVPGAVRARYVRSPGAIHWKFFLSAVRLNFCVEPPRVLVRTFFVDLSVSAEDESSHPAVGMNNVITGNATYDKSTNGGCGKNLQEVNMDSYSPSNRSKIPSKQRKAHQAILRAGA